MTDLILLAETIVARSQMGNNPQIVAIADARPPDDIMGYDEKGVPQ